MEDIIDCGPSPISLLRRSIDLLESGEPAKAINLTESLLALATDRFYAYPYKNVPRCWRRLYVDSSLVQSIARIRQHENVHSIVRTIDMALIMAGGEGRQQELHALLDRVEAIIQTKRQKLDIPEFFPINEPTALVLKKSILRVEAPSLETFDRHMKYNHTPLILKGCISHWPALKTWTSPRHLLARSLDGSRLVPIELGESYVAKTWTQKLVSFSTFIHDHLLKETIPRGYLAQHDLLKQIPALRCDIMVPDYCYLDPPTSPPDEPKVGHIDTDEVHMNIWLGPGGTRSPLHNDPYENIFAQVIGYKYFRLYPPRMTERVYPRGVEGGIEMGNTSQVKHLSNGSDVG
jgi:hypothetical protein